MKNRKTLPEAQEHIEFRGVGNIVATPKGDLFSDAWEALNGLPERIYYFESHHWYDPATLWEASVLSESKNNYTIRYETILWRESTFIRFEGDKRDIQLIEWSNHRTLPKESLDLKLEDAFRRIEIYQVTLNRYLREEIAKARIDQENLRKYEELVLRRLAEVDDPTTWP